jgi:hypothetical protein
MDKCTFQKEVDYGTVMLLVREMFDAGIISHQDYAQIEKMYVARYQPVFQNQMASFRSPENREPP